MNDTALPRRARARIEQPTYGASRWSGTYWLPASIGQFLDETLGPRESAPRILARFLCRFHGAPGTLGRSFRIMRECETLQERVGLSAKQIRNAITVLTKIGFIRRIEPPHPWRRSTFLGRSIRVAAEFAFTGVIAKFLRFMIERKIKVPAAVAAALDGPVRWIATLGEKILRAQDSEGGTPDSAFSIESSSLHPTGPSSRWSPRPSPERRRTPDATARATIDRDLAQAQDDPLAAALARLGAGVRGSS